MQHLKRKAMKRDTFIIEDKAVSVTGNDVWMTATEIAGLFHTTVPAVNAAGNELGFVLVNRSFFSVKHDRNRSTGDNE